jgi:hypothetical protein
MSYKEALSHPECKSSYHSMKGGYSRAYHDKQRRIKQRAINATNKIFEPIGKTGAKVISKVAAPVGRLAGKELGNAAATYLGQPELAPIFGKLGEKLGEKGAVSGSNALNKYVGNGIGVMPKEMRPLQFRGGASSSYDYSHLVIPKSGPGYNVKHATGTEKKHATSFWSWLAKQFGGSIMHSPYEHKEAGTFTKQLKAFNSHHKTKLSLPQLAKYVEKYGSGISMRGCGTNAIRGGSIVGFFVSELISMVKSEVKQEAIKIAKDFLKENNIDLEKYSKKVKDDFIETIKRLQQRIRNGENIREIEMTEITIPQPIIDDYIHINDRPQDTDIPIDEENEYNEFGDTSKIPGLAQGSMDNPYDKYYKKASGIKRSQMRGCGTTASKAIMDLNIEIYNYIIRGKIEEDLIKLLQYIDDLDTESFSPDLTTNIHNFQDDIFKSSFPTDYDDNEIHGFVNSFISFFGEYFDVFSNSFKKMKNITHHTLLIQFMNDIRGTIKFFQNINKYQAPKLFKFNESEYKMLDDFIKRTTIGNNVGEGIKRRRPRKMRIN